MAAANYVLSSSEGNINTGDTQVITYYLQEAKEIEKE